MQTRSTQDIPARCINAITSDGNYATVLKIHLILLFHYSGLQMHGEGTPTYYRVLIEPYLHFPRTSITLFLVRFDLLENFHHRRTLISDQTAIPNKAGSEGKERGKEKKESGLRGREEVRAREQCVKNEKKERKKKHPEGKLFTCHEASGNWSLHSTMSCIQLCLHGVRVTGRCWKTSVVVSPRILHQPPPPTTKKK